ncbi:TPA: hypothetical protein DCY65_01755 [Candidatus Acetothermia bacterium]|nr:hypothetical protein [Candidatus Acetothermia bacterium]
MPWEEIGFAFVFGAASSVGICLVSCTPIVLAYLLSTERAAKRFVSGLFLFILARAAVFIGVTVAIFLLGRLALNFIREYAIVLRIVGGLIISGAGALIFFDLGRKLRFFRARSQTLLFLAFLFGIKPCLPHIAIWGYILVVAGRAIADGNAVPEGGMLGAAVLSAAAIAISFSVGENLVPVVLGLLGGRTMRYLRGRGFRIATKIAGVVLFVLGIVFALYETVAPIIARAFA